MQNASTKGELQAAQKEFGGAQKRLQQLYSVIQMDEESKVFYGEEYNPATAGTQGGMSKSKPGTADWVAAQNVNNGFAKGTKEVYWDDNTGGYKIKFSGENIQGVIDKDARILFGYDPGKVPNINEKIYGTYQKNNFLDKNNQPTGNAMSNKNLPNNMLMVNMKHYLQKQMPKEYHKQQLHFLRRKQDHFLLFPKTLKMFGQL